MTDTPATNGPGHSRFTRTEKVESERRDILPHEMRKWIWVGPGSDPHKTTALFVFEERGCMCHRATHLWGEEAYQRMAIDNLLIPEVRQREANRACRNGPLRKLGLPPDGQLWALSQDKLEGAICHLLTFLAPDRIRLRPTGRREMVSAACKHQQNTVYHVGRWFGGKTGGVAGGAGSLLSLSRVPSATAVQRFLSRSLN
jgi:hypothetical protein